MFLLQHPVPAARVAEALLAGAVELGLIEVDGDICRAAVDVRPYGEEGSGLPGGRTPAGRRRHPRAGPSTDGC
jgi:hypothetical protein